MIQFNKNFKRLSHATFLTTALCALSLSLASCSSNSRQSAWETSSILKPIPAEQAPSDLSAASIAQVEQSPITEQGKIFKEPEKNVKVALLLPLSGPHEKLGNAMLNAAQLALFDLGFEQFELLPRDTRGNPDTAQQAAQDAIEDGAQLIIGPVFSTSVKAVKKQAQDADINMVAFSTDWSLADDDTYLIGFLPFDQIKRITDFAALAGYNRIGVISPTDSYGDAALTAYQMGIQNYGIETPRIERIPSHGEGITAQMRAFALYDERQAAYQAVFDELPEEEQDNKELEELLYYEHLPYDAVFMPMGGTLARQVGSFLSHYDLPPRDVRRLGTGLMDDATLAADRTLDGTWFAGPSPNARANFEKRYQAIYKEKPQRISSIAYDATALATTLARLGLQQNGKPAFDDRSITNPNGFFGVDGIFRFRRGGISERGLAVLEYQNGRIVVIEDAPKTFQKLYNTNINAQIQNEPAF